MADQKITELTELTSGQIADTDVLPIVDVDADATKKWTWASVKADILSWIGAVTATFTNKTIDADNNTITNIGTSELSDEGVTLAKMAHIATNRILGRATAGTGDVEALTATQVRSIINVEDGADVTDTANVTAAGALMDSEVTDLAGIKALQTSTLQLKPLEGAFVDGDKTKLDGIETGATADQTGAEIKALYEAEANTNAFTDAEQSKLSGIESGADVTDETNVVSALSGATLSDAGTPQATDKVLVQDSSDSDNLKYVDFSDFSSGTTVDVVSNVAADRILGRVTAGSGDSEELTATQVRTLINVEDGATADQTAAEIKTAYESNADTNAFTDAEQSKLSGIEASADVTDTANVTAAGALMDSEVTDLAGIKALDTSTLQVKPAEGAFVDGDKTKLDGIETGADVTDTANVTAAGALMDSEVDADIKTLSLPANTTISTFGASLVDDADASAARTTLGLGTLADDSAIDVAIGIACSDETTALTTGSAKVTFRMPYSMTLTDVRASLTGAGSTSGTTTIDINESGTTILSTKLTIDFSEKTSETAATAAVISDSALADDAEITIDIDAVTGGADETGLKVWLIGTKAVS